MTSETRVRPTGQRVATRRGDSGESWAFPLRVWFVHWLLVQLTATLTYRFGTLNRPSPPYGELPPPLTGLAHAIVEPLRQWDGLWYRLIALDGYAGTTETARAAFWPLYPWTMRAGGLLTGWPVDVVGYLVANDAFLGALLVLYRWISLDYGSEEPARRTLCCPAVRSCCGGGTCSGSPVSSASVRH